MNARARLLAILAMVTMSLWAAGPAAAGGPTSVLLSDAGSGRMAALHQSNPDYDTLAGYVTAFGTPPAPADAGEPPDRIESRPSVTLAWLIHDVHVWRVDRVFLGATPGDVWVSTQGDGGGGDLQAAPVWQRVRQGAELTALLTELGVNPAVRPVESGADPAPPTADPAADPVADPAADPATEPAAPAGQEGGGPGWLWVVVGLVGGVVLTLTAEQVQARRRERPAAGGRTELVDLERV
jgi:hypothetical protein